jgi:transposase-like protein
MLGLGSYRTAWFMAHRVREAMTGGFTTPMGGAGKVVEIDETFIGNKTVKAKKARGYAHKHAVLTLVERGGRSGSFHVDGTKAKDLLPILRNNIAKETVVMTDEAAQYNKLGADFKAHYSVTHGAGEYVRGLAHTNTVEGFYSVFKRGMKGVYQHCGEQHLHRYVAEFDFRYSNRIALGVDDTARTLTAIKGAEGKRLTYRQPA